VSCSLLIWEFKYVLCCSLVLHRMIFVHWHWA
jgi:hypothetical protein